MLCKKGLTDIDIISTLCDNDLYCPNTTNMTRHVKHHKGVYKNMLTAHIREGI